MAPFSSALGQNFSKMFDITVEDPNQKGEKILVWQNSWYVFLLLTEEQYTDEPYRGLSTRVIGVMVMIHGDNKGLVLPPRVSKIQVVIISVGITAKTSPEVREDLGKQIDQLTDSLKEAHVRTEVDSREG